MGQHKRRFPRGYDWILIQDVGRGESLDQVLTNGVQAFVAKFGEYPTRITIHSDWRKIEPRTTSRPFVLNGQEIKIRLSGNISYPIWFLFGHEEGPESLAGLIRSGSDASLEDTMIVEEGGNG